MTLIPSLEKSKVKQKWIYSKNPILAKSQREARGTIIHKKNVENDNEECRKWGYILIIYGVAVFTNVIIVFSAGDLSFFTDIWFLLPLALTIIAGMTILWVCYPTKQQDLRKQM